MSVVYPDDYPKSIHEAVMAAMEVDDDDIDYSDIPPITDEQAALAKPVGDKFIELRRKNAMFINRLLNEYYAKKGVTF
ncbi:MAG: hypothetical protein IJG65_08590 [Synergistaceae bacterium]|nr:hypothetical protein [Synergistaceae bacterium]